jgi:hypothetical protein
MSTYYQIFGGKINVLSSDPSNPVEGQMWYNTTSEVLKYRVGLIPAAWSSGGTMGTARYNLGRCRYTNSRIRIWWSCYWWCFELNRRI